MQIQHMEDGELASFMRDSDLTSMTQNICEFYTVICKIMALI
jgi:hypothetical protein